MEEPYVCKKTSPPWKRFFAAWPYLLLLCGSFVLIPAGLAQATPDPLPGPWSGQLHYGGESKRMGLRFVRNDKGALGMFIDVPELKTHNLGPVPVHQQAEGYKSDLNEFHSIVFRLAPDNKILTGAWSFDGHDQPFELKPGALPPETAPEPAAGRTAQPAWTFKTGGAIWSSPAVAGGTLYFGSTDGNIYALTASSGKTVWQFKTGGRVMGAPTMDSCTSWRDRPENSSGNSTPTAARWHAICLGATTR